MQVLISGASGFLGTALRGHLTAAGHHVIRLVRRPAHAPDERRWDPYAEVVELGEPDVVVNLSGAGLGNRRWTESYKNTIIASRIEPTSVLTRAIAAADRKPALLLNASGIGFYGETGDQITSESGELRQGFLAEVCRAWEAATRPAEDAGVRTIHLRNSPVLAASGGLLKRLLPLYKLGLAGRLGSGRQYMAWISLLDWLAAVSFLIDSDIHGPVNMCSPHPVPHAEFTEKLAAAVQRPVVLPVPEFAVKLALGELSTMVLEGQRAVPVVLTKAGFSFTHPDLDSALAWALKH